MNREKELYDIVSNMDRDKAGEAAIISMFVLANHIHAEPVPDDDPARLLDRLTVSLVLQLSCTLVLTESTLGSRYKSADTLAEVFRQGNSRLNALTIQADKNREKLWDLLYDRACIFEHLPISIQMGLHHIAHEIRATTPEQEALKTTVLKIMHNHLDHDTTPQVIH